MNRLWFCYNFVKYWSKRFQKYWFLDSYQVIKQPNPATLLLMQILFCWHLMALTFRSKKLFCNTDRLIADYIENKDLALDNDSRGGLTPWNHYFGIIFPFEVSHNHVMMKCIKIPSFVSGKRTNAELQVETFCHILWTVKSNNKNP